ncbi:MAG TPA: NIL domain-containing protein [Anaerovoracaceae bacterium]|nr:NIL domain-containing protein [Anaerovoracaceae bacterium]
MKSKVLLRFPGEITNTPIAYDLVKKYDLKINILRASIEYNMKGSLLLDLEGMPENIEKAKGYLKEEGIDADFINPIIKVDEDKCVDCGLCTSVCASNALTLSSVDDSLNFDKDKCVGCNLCINVCPTRAISV